MTSQTEILKTDMELADVGRYNGTAQLFIGSPCCSWLPLTS